jgi:hypothetical protein
MPTARTGGGKYVPDDMRFQILYRLPFRSRPNASIFSASTPAAPPFALTRWYASTTTFLEILNGFAWLDGSSRSRG